MHRRAHLLATVALVSALAPVVAGTPWEDVSLRLHSVRDAVMEAGSRFYGLGDILGGSLRSGSLGI